MASVLKVDKLDPQSGTALEIGTSGDTITVPTGAGLTVTDEVKTNKISPATGVAFALGDSGDTFTVPSGATIVNSGTATGFGGTNEASFSALIDSSGTENLDNATATTIPFSHEEFDTDGVFDNATYKFTAPSAGKYYFNWCVRKSNFTAARFYIDVEVNDSGVATFENGGGSVYGSIGGSIVLNLSLNDTVHGVYYQNSGGTVTVSANNSRFCGFKLIT